jgi:arginine/lysine/ornithine decarboxylase
MKITYGDDDGDADRLVDAFQRLVRDQGQIERQPRPDLPQPGSLELESVMLPRDAFFGRVEQVPAQEAVGRIGAEMLSPYPPGVPVVVPGERITQEVVDYLTSGPAAGMLIPDAADPEMKTFRVVA